MLAWLLAWGRTYVMAWVSERIAADLRNRTYGHMQGLSLEFFGGKRTGDLISRVSTDTDRICYFLSVYVLDFANDVLMLPDHGGDSAVRSIRCLPWRRSLPSADHRASGASGAQPACGAASRWARGPGAK